MKILEKEQLDVINSNESYIEINAAAGSGKTTVLISYSQKYPDKKILYLAYNESVVKEAMNKFPSNVTVLTSHQLAYKNVGIHYKHKLASQIKFEILRQALWLPKNKKNIILIKKVNEGIEKFIYSPYKDINESYYLVDNIPCSKEKYLFLVKDIWNKMINKDNDFPITHDFYLKLYQMQFPKLDFDIILFDEAQDANPATTSLVKKQNIYYGKKVVMVGDKNQEIYRFRGSQNALTIPNYFLSKTFRFGSNIAEITNLFLEKTKKEKNKIIGNENVKDFVDEPQNFLKTAIISRTNALVIANAIKSAENNNFIYFVGGIKNYNFNKLLNVSYLYSNQKKLINDNFIKNFPNIDTFERFSKEDENDENIFLLKIVNRYNEKILNFIDIIKNKTVTNIEQANVILSTAHKSKGLEFEQVILSNDFTKLFDKKERLTKVKEEELNIIYVAMTRAKYSLVLNNDLRKLRSYNE